MVVPIMGRLESYLCSTLSAFKTVLIKTGKLFCASSVHFTISALKSHNSLMSYR